MPDYPTKRCSKRNTLLSRVMVRAAKGDVREDPIICSVWDSAARMQCIE